MTIKKIEKSKEKRRENDGKKPCVLRHIRCWNKSDYLVFCIKQQRILTQITSWRGTRGMICCRFWENKYSFLAFHSLIHRILRGAFLTNKIYKTRSQKKYHSKGESDETAIWNKENAHSSVQECALTSYKNIPILFNS